MSLIRQLYDLQERHGHLSTDILRAFSEEARVPLYRLQELVSFYPHFRTIPPPRVEVAVCRDMACWLNGGGTACAQLKAKAPAGVEVREVSCLGRCEQAPAAAVNDTPVPANALLASEPAAWVEFSKAQPPSPTPRRWRCDPYERPEDRYSLLREFVSQPDAPDRIVQSLKDSGLRGMGGAGFPTGAKWDLVRKETRTPKYVICNADESEPGTFKDRAILHDLPHLVLEGMLLAGLVVGATKGILYIRHEYEPERLRFERALAEASRTGWLGGNIRGSGFNFEVEVFVSPGGYILGEETALLEALEDKRGEPRNKPPFPGTHGLLGQPTLINNVETLAVVPAIVRHGAAWWQAQGKPGFAGLKFMSVCGHVERPGVYEVPVGTTVRELIEVAGGMEDGRPLKAFAPGGASSPFLPAAQADVPLDFEPLAKAGSMLGSGALVVVAEGTDLLGLAANVVRFFR